MPFIDERRQPSNLVNIAPPDVPDDIDPSIYETFAAAFRTQNTIGSFMASRGQPDPYRIEEGFDAIDYVKDDPKFSPYVEEFAGIFNKEAAEAKKAQILREEADRRTRESAGMMGVAADIAAGVFDLPTFLIPGSVVTIGARTTGSLALGVASAAALDAGVSEAALQATQATRTAEETILNVGGSVLLGGALGGLVGRYMLPSDISAMSRKIEGQEQAWDEFDNAFRATGQGTSAGAAARDRGPLTLKDEAIIKRLPVVNRQDPLIRAQLSEFNAARSAVRGLAETPLEYADNARGAATELGGSVETRMKMWNAPLAKSVRGMDIAYARYFHDAPEPTGWQIRLSPIQSEFARRRGGQKLTYKQFKEEVGRAAYMGGQHEIPAVAEAAKFYREFDEGLKKAAIDAKLFTEDVDVAGDISHRFRVYNREKIIARRNEFTDILFDYFRAARDAASKADVAEAVDDAAKKAAAQTEEFSRLSDAELRDIVDQTIDTILGNAEGRIPYDIVAGPRGALKERVLKIESAKIHEFLENDIEQVMRMQLRTMAPDIEIARKFGSVDMAEQIRQINDEANARIARAKTEKERTQLERARKRAVADIEGIRDRLRGTYALPSDPASMVTRINRVARNLNYVRLLGGMTVSAIPDMAKIVFTHGLVSTFRDGFIPLIRSWKAYKAAAEEIKMAGTALDMILDSRTMALADITDDFGRHSKFERGLSALSSKFGVVSLMAPWNAVMKQFAGIVTMTNILRTTEKLAKGTATKAEIRKLAAAGIDEKMARRIWLQFAGGEEKVSGDLIPSSDPRIRRYETKIVRHPGHGEIHDGVYLAQTENWTDREAIEALRAAVVRDVDRIIVTPGQDKPLWMSTELGKTIGQFKSFSVSSMQRTMLAGIQQRDAATLNGTLLMLALGAATYALKERLADRELSDDPAVWAVNAFDRSGLTGWLMEANGISEKLTRGRVGASFFTGEQITRYASRNVTGAFLGPSADAVADIFQISGSIFAGDTTKSDLRRARMLLPMQNLFYARWLFNQVEEATGEGLNLPDTSR